MSLSALSVDELICRIRKQRKGSDAYKLLFERLWLLCDAEIEKVLRKRLGRSPWYWSDEDVKDIKQDVAIKVWDSLDEYEGRGPFAAWLGRVVGNAVVDEIRDRTGLRHLFSLNLSPTMEQALDEGTVPSELQAMFKERRVSSLRNPEVQKAGPVWIIFANKATKRRNETLGRYKAWRNGDQLDIYHWGTAKEPTVPQRRLGGDESGHHGRDRL